MRLARRELLIGFLLLSSSCGGTRWTAHKAAELGLAGVGRGRTILVVVTSHERFGDTGKKTGYWQSEITHFYKVATDVGFVLDFASPKGGTPPVDPSSVGTDEASEALARDATTRGRLEASKKLSEVDPRAYAAVYFPGGHGPLWDLPDNRESQALVRAIYESGGVVAAVCHGPAGLLNVRLGNGKPLLEGHYVTGFSNTEERMSGHRSTVPFLLADELQKRGAKYESVTMFRPHVQVSGRLVTGQNPNSTTDLAIEVVKLLARK